MLTWRTGWRLLEQQRSRLRQREDEFVEWVLAHPPLRLPGAAAIFTAASTGIPLGLTHHLRHNRVLHERVLLRLDRRQRCAARRSGPARKARSRSAPALPGSSCPSASWKARRDGSAQARLPRSRVCSGIDPEQITYYFRRVMVIPSGKVPGMAVWRKALFAAMHLNANLPAAYFGVPTAQVVEVGLEVEI